MAHPYLALRLNRNVMVSHYVVAGSKNPLPLGMGSVNFKDIMDEEIKSQNTKAFQELTTRFQQDISRLAIFFKQNEFKSEQEYRIAFENPSKQSLSFREKDGFLLPYIQIYVGKLPLLSITVAPKNHVDLAPAGMRAYLDYLGYDTTVYFSQLKLRY